MEYDLRNAELIHSISLFSKIKCDNLMKKYNLTFSQVNLLLCLIEKYQGFSAFKDIEKSLNIAQSTTVLLIDKLKTKGFVEVIKNEKDKRVKYVKVTEKGNIVSLEILKELKEFKEKLFVQLTEGDKDTLFRLLSQVNLDF